MIQGKRINLRMIKESDLDELIAFDHDLEHRGEFLSVHLRNAVQYKKQYHETGFWNDDSGVLLITDKEGNIVGSIGYFKGVHYMPGYEIGYSIYRKENRGKGYTSEALKLFSAYLFEIKPINRLEVHAAKENLPSCKVAEKCGFQYEGLKRQAVLNRGRYMDLNIYSMLKEECPSFTEMIKNQ